MNNKKQRIIQSVIDDIKVWVWALHKIKGDFLVDFTFTENFIPQQLKNTKYIYKVRCSSYNGRYKLQIKQSLKSSDMNFEDNFSETGNFNKKSYKLKSKNLNYLDSQNYEKYKVSFPRTEMTNRY